MDWASKGLLLGLPLLMIMAVCQALRTSMRIEAESSWLMSSCGVASSAPAHKQCANNPILSA